MSLKEGQTFWVCAEGDFITDGTDEDAHKHHSEEGCWDHWIYEFKTDERSVYPYEATGREIHTSDGGSYYLRQKPDTPQEVYETFARRVVNELIRGLSTVSSTKSYTVSR